MSAHLLFLSTFAAQAGEPEGFFSTVAEGGSTGVSAGLVYVVWRLIEHFVINKGKTAAGNGARTDSTIDRISAGIEEMARQVKESSRIQEKVLEMLSEFSAEHRAINVKLDVLMKEGR